LLTIIVVALAAAAAAAVFFSAAVFLPSVPPWKSWAKNPPPPAFLPPPSSALGVHGFELVFEAAPVEFVAFGRAVDEEEAADEDGPRGGDESLRKINL
jgi:hypothetical protein